MTISIFDYCSQIVIGRYKQASVVSLWVCESSSSFHFIQQVDYALFGDRVAGLLEGSFRRHGKAVIWNAVLLAIMWCTWREHNTYFWGTWNFSSGFENSFFFSSKECYTFGLQQWAIFLSQMCGIFFEVVKFSHFCIYPCLLLCTRMVHIFLYFYKKRYYLKMYVIVKIWISTFITNHVLFS